MGVTVLMCACVLFGWKSQTLTCEPAFPQTTRVLSNTAQWTALLDGSTSTLLLWLHGEKAMLQN